MYIHQKIHFIRNGFLNNYIFNSLMFKYIIQISGLFFMLFFLISGCQPEVIKKNKPSSSISVINVTDYYARNKYTAVKIGKLYWFQKNLNAQIYTVFKKVLSGSNIDSIHSYKPYSISIIDLPTLPTDTLAAQWPYKGTDSLTKKYGRMYTWYAASDARNVCPSGWHVPTANEWDDMISYMGSDSLAGGKLKDTSNTLWNYPNLAEFNVFKFNAKPTGYRSEFGSYLNEGKFSFFWSSTSDPDDKEYAICYVLYAHSKKIIKRRISKRAAMAIRCVR